jgi:SPOR domain
MAQDFAKKRARSSASGKPASRKRKTQGHAASQPPRVWRWYGAGVLTGVLLCFLMYLGTLPADSDAEPRLAQGDAPIAEAAPKPRFDFYTLLPQQTIDVEVDPAEISKSRSNPSTQLYLLQAGSFRQGEDADRRRAELLLLGLEPKIEETSGDNGRWFRVYVGPFESRSQLAKARSLTAAQDIDTLLLKRSKP